MGFDLFFWRINMPDGCEILYSALLNNHLKLYMLQYVMLNFSLSSFVACDPELYLFFCTVLLYLLLSDSIPAGLG
jgi:hypothetical protein